MNHYAAVPVSLFGKFILVVVFLLVPATPLLAQRQVNTPQPASPEHPATNPAENASRSANVDYLEHGKDEAKRREAAQLQMNEDFERIQTVDRDILTAASTDAGLDYKLILAGLVDIRKRAVRLRDTIGLPTASKDEKWKKSVDESNAKELRPALVTLNGFITSFVSNPVLSRNTSVDPALAAKARRDLDGIIDFSDKVRKSVEKMSKAASNEK
jgi:hypothetical protein